MSKGQECLELDVVGGSTTKNADAKFNSNSVCAAITNRTITRSITPAECNERHLPLTEKSINTPSAML